MVNKRAPFRISAALTFPLTKSAAAHAQALPTRASGDGASLPRAFGCDARAAGLGISFNTASGATATAPPYGDKRFAGDGVVSTVTAIGVMSNEFGQL